MNVSELVAINRRNFAATLLASVAPLVALAGCGDGMARVSGQVSLDGKPIEGGRDGANVTIQFLPASGIGPNGVALVDSSGRYTVGTGSRYGVVPGEYFVTCTFRPANPGDPVPDPKFSNAKTSTLKCTATPGRNEFDIPLQTPPKTMRRTGA